MVLGVKVLAEQACQPELNPQNPYKMWKEKADPINVFSSLHTQATMHIYIQ